jgi:thioredoxin-related protein
MKFKAHILLIVLIRLVPLSGFSQPAELATIFSNAKTQKKNVLVYVHAAYCIPCRLLEKSVLPVPTVKDSLQKFVFISTSLDSSNLGIFLAKKYGLNFVPTFLLLSPEGYLLRYKTGVEADTTHFLQLLANLKADGRIKGFSPNFSIVYPRFYDSHYSKPKDGVDSAQVSSYLMKQADLETEVNFNVLRVMPIAPKFEYYFLTHYRSYSEKFGPLYAQRVEQMYLHNLKQMTGEKDTAKYKLFETAMYVGDSILARQDRDWLKSFRYLSFVGRSGANWQDYARLLDGWEESYGDDHLDNFSRDIYKTCPDASVCSKMAHYIGISLPSAKDTDEFTYLRYAVLLYKGGQPDSALTPYKKALAISPDDEKRSWVRQEWNQFAIDLHP